MPSLADRIAFAQNYVANKEGARWTLNGREWVRDKFWLPADGFKLWLPDEADVCVSCKSLSGRKIVEHPDDNPTKSEEHRQKSGGCGGLDARPIIVTILNVHRQEGKTFNTMAYALSTLLLGQNKSFAFVAASEDQAEALFRENYRQAIERNEQLRELVTFRGMGFQTNETNGYFEALPASPKSVTGRTRTHVLVDEARDVSSDVFVELVQSIQAMGGGIECPFGHVQISKDKIHDAPKSCSACKSRLVPWFPRIIVTSSSGVVDPDSDTAWMSETIEDLEREPDAAFFVYRSEEPSNPNKTPEVLGALDRLRKIDTLAERLEANLDNQWRSKGTPVVSDASVSRATDKSLRNIDGCKDPCVAFVDASLTEDKTSLVILADDRKKSEFPWQYIYQARLDYWIPAEMPRGSIDETIIEPFLVALLPFFPGLVWLGVDIRKVEWPKTMCRSLKAKHPFIARILEPWNRNADESSIGWEQMQSRILARPEPTIRLQEDKWQRREFKGVKWWRPKGAQKEQRIRVVDIKRDKSHKDITENMATCCYKISRIQVGGASLGMAHFRDRSESVTERLKHVRRPLARGLGEDSF